MFPMRDPGVAPKWTFITNHGHVLLCLARAPELRLRDVAERVGVTERAVQRIIADLEEAGYLTRRRTGRQNAYEIDVDRPMRHPAEAPQTVRALVDLVGGVPRTPAGQRGLRRRGGQARPRSRTS